MYRVGYSLETTYCKDESLITSLDIASGDEQVSEECTESVDLKNKDDVLKFVTTMLSKHHLKRYSIVQKMHVKLVNLGII